MRTVYLSAGHTNVQGQDRGANSKDMKYIEGVETVRLRDSLQAELLKRNVKVVVDPNENALAKTLVFFKKLVGIKDIAIDIHFDAGGGTGCSTFIPKVPTQIELELGFDLASMISHTLVVRNRGRKTELESHHTKLGWMTLNCENVLIETCFIDNHDDMQAYNTNYDKLVIALCNIIERYAKYK